MTSSAYGGFWSYVHKDDKADNGRVQELAKDVREQFEMLTGETIELFLDRDALEWGDDWESKIDESLATVAFFIPVMTPRYFESPQCRREVQFFARRAENLGLKELVLPLLYVSVPKLDEDEPNDELVELLKKFQWEDWRDLRFEERSSKEYRQAVSRLAERLVAANHLAEKPDVVYAAVRLDQQVESDLDDELGLVDHLARAEEALPSWTETLTSIGRQIEIIGQLMQDGADEIQKRNRKAKGFAHRLLIARQLSNQLKDPTDEISGLSNRFVSEMHHVDSGFRAIISHAPSEIETNPDALEEYCSFFETVRHLSASADAGLASLGGMVDSISSIEGLSRDMRPVLRKLRSALTVLVEAQGVTGSWVSLIAESGVDCSEFKHEG